MFIAPKSLDRRTRLIHTIEVFQIGSSMARRFNLNLSAVEAMCFAHDLGHPPFGHAGEEAIDKLILSYGGFHHAAHSVRVVDELAYDESLLNDEVTSGLNLTYAIREGILKHGWFENREFSRYHFDLETISSEKINYLNKCKYGSLEAQVLQIADGIAYLNHDIDDLIAYGFDKILSRNTITNFFTEEGKRRGELLTNT